MRRRLLVFGFLAAALLWLVIAIVWLVLLAGDLREGRDAATEARDQLNPEAVADGKPLGDLRRARARLEAASDRAGGLVLAPLRILPVVGRQLRSVDALATAAADVADVGADAVERAMTVFEDPAEAGPARVAQVREISEIVDGVAARLAEIDDLGPRDGLVGPLADARNDLAEEITDARDSLADARTGARAALSLVEGPRRYLVVAANNAEMRAGSGMWLQGGILRTEDGRLELDEMQSLPDEVDPPDGAAVPTGDLAARWGFLNPGDEWRNLMLSPSFPASAELAVEMWRAAGREDVDGVLVVDAIGLQALVEVTGAVTVGDERLDADEVPAQVLHDQYLEFGDLSADEVENTGRREELAELASAAVAAVNDGDYEAARLVRVLGDAIEGRHVLAWSSDDLEQAGWQAAGMSGELEEDDLLVALLNRGGNKLDWFVAMDAELEVEGGEDGWDVRVTIDVRNESPASGEPRYVVGPHPEIDDLDPGAYRGILAVTMPRAAQDARFDGVDRYIVAGRDGPTRVAGFQFDLARGESRTIVLRFRLPPSADHLVVRSSARVPAVGWRYRTSGWEDIASRTTNWGTRG